MQLKALKMAKLKKEGNKAPIIEKEKAIPSSRNPIADRLISQVSNSLIASQKEYQKYLAKIPNKCLAQKLLMQHKLKNAMLLSKIKYACQECQFIDKGVAQHAIQVKEPRNQNQQFGTEQLNGNYLLSIQHQQANLSSSMFKNVEQTSSYIHQRCMRQNLYQKKIMLSQYHKIKFKQHQSNLFDRIIQHFCLIIAHLRNHKQKLRHTIKHIDIMSVPIQYGKCSMEWLPKIYKEYFVVLMEKGYYQEEIFNVSKYLSAHNISPLEYLIQISRALDELYNHQIYHLDINSTNIIPVQQEGATIFKVIDFQFSLYLGSQNQELAQNRRSLWRLMKDYWEKDRSGSCIVYNLFQSLLCPALHFTEGLQLLPGQDLFDLLLLNSENQSEFVQYLKKYCSLYYRNSLFSIYQQLLPQHKELHSAELQSIIKSNPLSQIGKGLLHFKANC